MPAPLGFSSLDCSEDEANTKNTGLSSGFLSGQSKSLPDTFPHRAHAQKLGRALDPHKMAVEFPDRWRALMHSQYQGRVPLIMSVFQVCEKTATKWLNGLGGCRGDKVAIAMQESPVETAEILFGIAAD